MIGMFVAVVALSRSSEFEENPDEARRPRHPLVDGEQANPT
jgi:hypothetical protein